MRRRTFLSAAAGVPLLAQAPPAGGPQVATFLSDVDDTDQPYALYVPPSYDAARKWPLVISLHDAFSNHRLNLRRLFGVGNRALESDAQATRYFPRLPDVPFLAACPWARGTLGYQGIPERDVYAVLAEMKSRFNVDEDRIYLTGLSMGGGGALWLGLTQPDRWAAIAPVCPLPPEDAALYSPNALHLPAHLFHGAADPLAPVAVSREWQKRLAENGARVEYIEYPNVRHNAWDFAYRNASIFSWFSKFRRQRFPARVRFTSPRYRYSSAYWLQFDRLTPGVTASAEAAIGARSAATVRTSNLDALTLRLPGHPLLPPKSPLSVTLDGTRLSLRPGAPASFTRSNNDWRPGAVRKAPNEKRAGAEGPIADAFAARHIYVYGTAGDPSSRELARRREQAEHAADWSRGLARLSLALRAVPDRELTSDDFREASLILFGTRETNTLLAKFDASLPIALNPSAADYSLTFVYPLNGRYVVVNSGLPFWLGSEQVKRRGLVFDATRGEPPTFALVQTFADYLLFKGSLENIVAEGRFDTNWTLPRPQADKMRATGAVEIR
ncbi:MAG: alpha/beta hydrolase-fold protein [Bryobacteraceae bacterium]|nr:alpha/beta hydrolase-fold protein [Bryobacteraceae bacterium]